MARFEVGRIYTRRDITDAIGGSMVSYLPTVDGRVVCGCFSTDLNPDAPEIVLPGTGPGIEGAAKQVRRQTEPIPVFMKAGSGRWRYVGLYRPKSRVPTPEERREHARRAGRTDVTTVLWFERVGTG